MEIVDGFAEGATFELREPTVPPVPFVFSVPHSGTAYPRELLQRTRLDRLTLRRSEDTFVDALFSGVVRHGAPLLRARFPRVYVDLNRDPGEIDPAMFDAPPELPINADSARVTSGLGVIARIVGEGQDIYDAALPAAEAAYRLARFYRPYHDALDARIAKLAAAFGSAVLVDCHSMPSGAVRPEAPGAPRADVIIGDRYGTSCSPRLAEEFARLLRRNGFVVGRNRPYAGGFITERHGRPPTVHAIQIEINRALYMDEATYTVAPGFDALSGALEEVCSQIIDWFVQEHSPQGWAQAAE